MRLCVISPGVAHAVPRTLAIAPHFAEMHYIDAGGRGDTAPLAARGIICNGPPAGQRSLGTRDLRYLIGTIAPDAIVCHFAAGDHFLSALAYGKCPVAAIAMGHDVLYDEGDRKVPRFERLMIRIALRRASLIAAKSRGLADRLGRYGVLCPVVVNYWGADLDRFAPGSQADARKLLGLDRSATIVLSPRALEPRLNIHILVEAFQVVRRHHPAARLILLGRSDAGYRQRIEQMLDRLDLRTCTQLIDEVSQETLPAYYRAADVMVSLARSEGFPNSVLETMGCRIPVVIGRIPQIDELLKNDRNARICEIDPDSVAAAINDVIGDPQKRANIVEAAFRTVRESGDIRRNGESFSKDLVRVMKGLVPESRIMFRLMFLLYRIHRRLLRPS